MVGSGFYICLFQDSIERQLAMLRLQSKSTKNLYVVLVMIAFLLILYILGIRVAYMPLINKMQNVTLTARILRLKKRHILLATGFVVFLTLTSNMLRLSRSPTVINKSIQQ